MNKKILLSAGMIVAIAAVAAGATYAAWQAQDTIADNIVSTVKLEIEATGAAGAGAVDKPIIAEDILPDWQTVDPERALITNKSGTALDLWYYVDNVSGLACEAVALAWHAGPPGGDGSQHMGYDGSKTWAGVQAYEGTDFNLNVADLTGVSAKSGNLTLIGNLKGVANAVKIADSSYFGEGNQVAIREVAYFAKDANNSLQGKTCKWTEYFVGTLPGKFPEGYTPPAEG